jgi:hypothetical protein
LKCTAASGGRACSPSAFGYQSDRNWRPATAPNGEIDHAAGQEENVPIGVGLIGLGMAVKPHITALRELEAEGGIAGRAARYRRNHDVLVKGMRELGFEAYLSDEDQSPIITTYRYPSADFCFDEFYSKLSDLGFVIYPGKLTQEPCFRIGTIGRIGESDIANLLQAIRTVTCEMTRNH